jgi:hypothetical protein
MSGTAGPATAPTKNCVSRPQGDSTNPPGSRGREPHAHGRVVRGGGNLLGGRAVRHDLLPLTSAELPDLSLDKALNRGLLPSHYLSDRASSRLAAYVGDYLRECGLRALHLHGTAGARNLLASRHRAARELLADGPRDRGGLHPRQRRGGGGSEVDRSPCERPPQGPAGLAGGASGEPVHPRLPCAQTPPCRAGTGRKPDRGFRRLKTCGHFGRHSARCLDVGAGFQPAHEPPWARTPRRLKTCGHFGLPGAARPRSPSLTRLGFLAQRAGGHPGQSRASVNRGQRVYDVSITVAAGAVASVGS